MIIHISKNHNTQSVRKLALALPNDLVIYHGNIKMDYADNTLPVKYNLIRHLWLLRLIYIFYIIYKNKINLNKVQLVHAHTVWGDGLIAFFLKVFKNIPYLISVRYSDIKISKYKFWLRPIISLILRNAKARVAISKSIKSKIKNYYPNYNYQIITNWIDEEFYNIKSTGFRNIDFLIIGRPVQRKQILESITFFKKTKFKVHIIFGGLYETKYAKKCLNLIKKSDNISFSLKVDKLKIIDYMDKSKVLWLPSKNETMGLVYVEALLRGCVAVGRINEGLYEYLKHPKMLYINDDFNYRKFIDLSYKLSEKKNKIESGDLDSYKKEIILQKWKDLYVK